MNDCIKPFRMSCSVSPECIRGFHEPVWTTSACRADVMEEVAYWDGEGRRLLRRERLFERCAALFALLALLALVSGCVIVAAALLLTGGVAAGLAGRASSDAAAAFDFRDWTWGSGE